MLKKELRALKKSEKEKIETPAAADKGNMIEVFQISHLRASRYYASSPVIPSLSGRA